MHHEMLARPGEPAPLLAQAASGAWRWTRTMATARRYHTATLLNDGRVVVAGGSTGCGFSCSVTNASEVFNPASGTWSSAGSSMTTDRPATGSIAVGRDGHTLVLLPNGAVVVPGGEVVVLGGLAPTAASELYTP